MYRVLIFGMTPNPGGIESSIINYMNGMVKKNIAFDFINSYEIDMAYSDIIREKGGQIYQVPNFKKNPIKYYLNIKKIMKNYDIVHINILSYANILPIISASRSKINNIIIHSHNGNIPGMGKKILHRINYQLVKNIGKKIACSKVAGDFMFKKQEYEILPNFINASKYQFNENIKLDLRERYKIKDKIVLGHVGKFCEQKNQIFIIKMFEKLKKKHKNYVLFLVGDYDSEYGKKIINYINKKHLDNIFITGKTNNVTEYLSLIDIFLMPSKFEGLSVVLLEAQVNGLPILASNNISKETKISDKTFFLDLDLDLWINKIEKIELGNRMVKLNTALIDEETNCEHLKCIYLNDWRD